MSLRSATVGKPAREDEKPYYRQQQQLLPGTILTEEASFLACSSLTKRGRGMVSAKVVLELRVLDWSVPLSVVRRGSGEQGG